MKYAKLCIVFLTCSAATFSGCGPDELYNPQNRAVAVVSPKKTWAIRGSIANLPAAIDGDLTTAARAEGYYAGTEITIDLKQTCVFQTVIIDHGADLMGHCRTVALSSSLDGKVFVDRYVAPGTRRVTILCLPNPVAARYIRLKAVVANTSPWNLAEIYIQ